MDLGEGWSHVVTERWVVKDTTPTPQAVTEAPEQTSVTATRKTAKPKMPAPKPTAATKTAPVKPNKEAKPWLPNPKPMTCW
jgi:hypothetical protein